MSVDSGADAAEPEGLVASDGRGSHALRILTFMGVFLAWIAIWWTPVGWALDGVVPGGWGLVALVAILTMLPLLVLVHAFQNKTPPSVPVRVFVVRPFWYVQLLVPFVSIIVVLAGLVGLVAGSALQWARGGLVVGLVLAGLAVGVGYWGAHRLVLRRLEVAHPRLPASLDGLRLVQLSDLHFGAHTRKEQVERVRTAVRMARPDLIVLTGDQVDDYGRDVEALVAALAGLEATHGIVAVPGNHDVYVDWPTVRQGMQDAGYQVLVNQALPFAHNDDSFWVAGTGDPAGRHIRGAGGVTAPDLDAAMRHVPEGAFVIALAHNPALWPGLAARGAHVTLSGHTHHGQFSIPRWNWSLASVFLRHAMGHHTNGDAWLYIAPGTHYWGVPLRIGAWPEVTQVTLRRGDGAGPVVLQSEVQRVPVERAAASSAIDA